MKKSGIKSMTTLMNASLKQWIELESGQTAKHKNIKKTIF